MTDRVAILTAVFVAIAAAAHAQEQVMVPLADVARQADAAKATARKATKTYTNANLSADPTGETNPAPAAASAAGLVSKSLGQPLPAAEVVARSEAKVVDEAVAQETEDTWRMRAEGLRKQVDHLRERLAQLTIPNRLTDDSPLLKKAQDTGIANARSALDQMRKQWARLEASAREVKIPMSWIEPLPTYPQ